MSLTLLVWCALLATLVVLTLRRPAWGVAVYMLTFFALPAFWWWGRPIAHYRWSLIGGAVLLSAAILAKLARGAERDDPQPVEVSRLRWLAILILVNATAVHVLLAPNPAISEGPYWLLAKFVLLFFLIVTVTRTRDDLRIVLLSIVLGAGYIGYECTINDRGRLRGTRLEGVGAPGASEANFLASLMVTVLPVSGAFFLAGRPWEKLLMLPVAPFMLNVVLLCNSRGAFLALLATGAALLLFAPRDVRKRIMKLLALGAVAAWFLLGDPRIVDRFLTTFSSKEERDSSAQSRLDYWVCGLRMIADHPLGAGGHGFKRVYGPNYIAEDLQVVFDGRAVHNGFINEACEWGIQGFVLRMAFMGGGLLLLWRSARSPDTAGDPFARIVAMSVFAGTVAFLVSCLFIDGLDAEWGYWMVALAVAQARVFSVSTVKSRQVAHAKPVLLWRSTASGLT